MDGAGGLVMEGGTSWNWKMAPTAAAAGDLVPVTRSLPQHGPFPCPCFPVENHGGMLEEAARSTSEGGQKKGGGARAHVLLS
ncbi:hypothetical protein GGTG_04787 [Gaeumannomyces tritici R3-111a-1]|uniref:Uncharacterized protein n=1 Tax=Gaeumannomyces tritici (strain R3-111a-1) TaxID=644352 RepID=J3NU36_GAET3|nr:hypothetical protein GGTG_04787 [Gaeumannomyces tritici R3-111a-1]EJT79703.1 hypothetical protein GGTG_04787 [Gaeumannomyces tritici R3-111a-1]